LLYIKETMENISLNKYIKEDIVGGSFSLPFQTKRIDFSELREGDIVVEQQGWEVQDVVFLYKVIRINTKSVTLRKCDRYGIITFPTFKKNERIQRRYSILE